MPERFGGQKEKRGEATACNFVGVSHRVRRGSERAKSLRLYNGKGTPNLLLPSKILSRPLDIDRRARVRASSSYKPTRWLFGRRWPGSSGPKPKGRYFSTKLMNDACPHFMSTFVITKRASRQTGMR